MANTTLSPEVTSVLKRSTITGNVLALPPGQLERSLYESVNKALTNAGGRWKRGQGHVFPGDPRAKLGLMLETGVAVDEKKKFQAFYTPGALAKMVVSIAQVKGMLVLEPSAGNGALVDECLASGARFVEAVEVNEECRQSLIGPRKAVAITDFLSETPEARFDRVVMNPPFSKNQDIAHVAHAMKFLKPGGILVAIMSPNTERPKLKALLAGRDHDFTPVDAGAFKESGTSIATVILKIRI